MLSHLTDRKNCSVKLFRTFSHELKQRERENISFKFIDYG